MVFNNKTVLLRDTAHQISHEESAGGRYLRVGCLVDRNT